MNIKLMPVYREKIESMLEKSSIPHDFGIQIFCHVIDEIEKGNTYFTSGHLKYHLNAPDSYDIYILQMLVEMSNPNFNLFQMGFNFVGDNNEQMEISVTELNEAALSGVFYNPATGLPVEEFMKNIYPFFKVIEN